MTREAPHDADRQHDTDEVSAWSVPDDAAPDWVPPPTDISRPSVARMYDYYLGGKDNYAIDRAAAEQVLQTVPDGRDWARTNRKFLTSAVQRMASAGVRQFIDLGTGIPTSPNVHETARAIQPDAAVVYVDNDPAVMAYNRALRATTPGVVTVNADIRNPERVLDSAQVCQVIDFTQPVGLLLIAVLHFIDHSSSPEILSGYLRRLPRGSYLSISVATSEGMSPETMRQALAVYRSSSAPGGFRTRAQVEELFDGVEILAPGVIDLFEWTSGTASTSTTSRGLVGLGVKR